MAAKPFLRKVDNWARTKESVFQENGKARNRWGNEDLDPTPPRMRSWKHWNYFLLWWSLAFNPVQWNTGSSLVNQGMLWWQATISIFVGNLICCVILVLSSRGPALYHIGYPAYIRASAGMYGSYFFILLRGAVAILYTGTQTYFAGKQTNVMLRCIFGHSWTNIPNHLPASAGITSRDLAAFFIYFFIQLPFMLIHPEQAKWLYAIKSVLAPPTLFAVFGWMMAKNHGLRGATAITDTESETALGWAFMAGINSVAGSIAPEIMSNADLARYSRKPSDAGWSQALGVCSSKTLVIFLGIASSSASKTMYGTAYWNMWDLFDKILDQNWNAGARAALALASLIQILAVMATNLAANCIPVGSDLTGLFPRYFNIRRGQVFCVFFSLVTVPWKLQTSAKAFLTFLGSYVCFIAPVIGIMIADFWLVRNGNIHIPSLYNGSPTSTYWYYRGFNMRMYVAWIFGTAIVIHGLSGSYDIHATNQASKNMYTLGFLLASATGSVFYLAFCRIWPVQTAPHGREEWSSMLKETREYLARTDGYLEDELGRVEEVVGDVDGVEYGYRDDGADAADAKILEGSPKPGSRSGSRSVIGVEEKGKEETAM